MVGILYYNMSKIPFIALPGKVRRAFFCAFAAALHAMLLSAACSGPANSGEPVTPPPFCDTLTDSRDGKSYRTVAIGTQVWMAENLNYGDAGGKCYGEDGQVLIGWDDAENKPVFTELSDAEIQANCDRYGRLYDWAAAMELPPGCNSGGCAGQIHSVHRGICPAGWHIPSDAEWETLVRHVDPDASGNDNNIAGTKLKAAAGWYRDDSYYIPGTDDFGFSAMPGGIGYSGLFDDDGYYGIWWSASEYGTGLAWYRDAGYDSEYAGRYYYYKAYRFSVRCIQD